MKSSDVTATIIIPWFGRWPFWMPFFLESCRANRCVRWLMYSDCDALPNWPGNVELRTLSFTDYKELVSDRLGIHFQPESPYKLCDLKPALGYIHADELGESEFFGFGDTDVVYGDLLGYFDEALRAYDCISTHGTRVSGHLCLLRNRQHLREAFRKIPQWRELLESQKHCFMDEKHFSKVFRRGKNLPDWARRAVTGFNRYARGARFKEEYTTPRCDGRLQWIHGNDDLPEAWYWREGRILSSQTGEREFPYLHFYDWKYRYWHDRPEETLLRVDATTPDKQWAITAEGFRALSDIERRRLGAGSATLTSANVL